MAPSTRRPALPRRRLRLAAAGGAVAFDGTAAADAVTGRATVGFSDIAPLSPLAGRSARRRDRRNRRRNVRSAMRRPSPSGDTATDLAAGDAPPGPAARRRRPRSRHRPRPVRRRLRRQRSRRRRRRPHRPRRGDLCRRHASTSSSMDRSPILAGWPTSPPVRRPSRCTRRAPSRVLTWRRRVTVAKGTLLDQPVRDARVDREGRARRRRLAGGAQPRTAASPAGTLAGTAIATVDGDSGALAFPEVDLAVGNNRITGAVEGTAAGLFSGSLALDAPDLRTLAALALVPASGKGQASIRLQPDGGGQSVAVRFKGSGIAYQDIAVGGHRRHGHHRRRLRCAEGARQRIGDRRDCRRAAPRHGSGEGDGRRRGDAHRGRRQGAGHRPLQRSPPGRRGGHRRHPQGHCLRHAGQACSKPVTIALDGGTTRIGDATLTLGGGSLRVDGNGRAAARHDRRCHRNFRVRRQRLRARPRRGRVGQRTCRRSPARRPRRRSTGRWTWTGFALAATRDAGLPALAIEASGKSTLAASTVAARLSGAGLALHCRRQGAVRRRRPRLEGQRHGAPGAAGAPLRARTPACRQRQGRPRPSAVRSPTPAVSGAVDLDGATIIDGETGFGISGASGRIDFDGRTATIQQISGRFAQGGDVVLCRHDRHRSGRPAGGPDGADRQRPLRRRQHAQHHLLRRPRRQGAAPRQRRRDRHHRSRPHRDPAARPDRRLGRTPSTCATSTPRRASRRRYRSAEPAGDGGPRRRGGSGGLPLDVVARRQFRHLRSRLRHRRRTRRHAEGRRNDRKPAGGRRLRRCSAAAWMPSASASPSPQGRLDILRQPGADRRFRRDDRRRRTRR